MLTRSPVQEQTNCTHIDRCFQTRTAHLCRSKQGSLHLGQVHISPRGLTDFIWAGPVLPGQAVYPAVHPHVGAGLTHL